MHKFVLLCVCSLLYASVGKAQIKYQPVEFQLFAHQFPVVELPFALDSVWVWKKTEHEDYERIERRYAEMFLGVSYLQGENEDLPTEVTHYVASFKAYQTWTILIYYSFPYPPKKTLQDSFKIAVFDYVGGIKGTYTVAGTWDKEQKFASIKPVGKDIIIEVVSKPSQETVSYLFNRQGSLVKITK
jgi:hypothetical protein